MTHAQGQFDTEVVLRSMSWSVRVYKLSAFDSHISTAFSDAVSLLARFRRFTARFRNWFDILAWSVAAYPNDEPISREALTFAPRTGAWAFSGSFVSTVGPRFCDCDSVWCFVVSGALAREIVLGLGSPCSRSSAPHPILVLPAHGRKCDSIGLVLKCLHENLQGFLDALGGAKPAFNDSEFVSKDLFECRCGFT